MSNVKYFDATYTDSTVRIFYGDEIIYETDGDGGIRHFLNTVIKPWMEKKSEDFAQHLAFIEQEQKNELYQLRKDYEARLDSCERDLAAAEDTIDALRQSLKSNKSSYGIGVEL